MFLMLKSKIDPGLPIGINKTSFLSKSFSLMFPELAAPGSKQLRDVCCASSLHYNQSALSFIL